MDLLNWKNICSFNQNKLEKEEVLIAFYAKKEEEFDIKHKFEENLNKNLIEFLKKSKASEKCGDKRIYEVKPEDKVSFVFICLVCIGNDENVVENARKASASGVNAAKSLKMFNIVISTAYLPQEVSFGATLALYNYTVLKKKKDEKIAIAPDTANEEFERGALIGKHQNIARFLADTPANLMTPTLFVEYAKDILKGAKNVKITVHEIDYIKSNNMNLFLSVTEGSEQPPKFLVVKYQGNKNDTTDLSLVGKGITFDSGGISLKGSAKMREMKADMMGGATVLSAISLASALDLKINITVSVPLCENLPSGKASKPGDVRIGMSGISVEIDNTDAEGRLILGDALVHAQKENPKYLIDVATLTGAMRVALGNVYMGLFCNNDGFANLISKAGEEVDDLVWRMPLTKKFRAQMDSQVADMINAATGGGGSCTAAIFLNEFIDKERKWAHLDIASTMCDAYHSDLYGKGMSGKPLRLLFEVAEKISKENQ